MINKQILTVLLFALLFACNNQDKTENTGMPLVDVSKTYPETEIKLQDIADVDYIPLETKDSVLLADWAGLAYTSNDTIIVYNGSQGDIFIFDGKGGFLSKFNRKGQSGMEYLNISEIIYTPNTKELFVFDMWSKRKVFVYNIQGDYVRSFDVSEKYNWDNITNYNDSLFLCYDNNDFASLEEDEKENINPYLFISKLDGHVAAVDLTVENRIKTMVITQQSENSMSARMYGINSFISLKNEFLINDLGLDTVYRYTSDKKLIPFMVKQPPVQNMPTDTKVWLDIKAISDKYMFMQTAYKTGNKKGEIYKTIDLYLDKKSNKIFQYKLVDEDYKDKKYKSFVSSLITPDRLITAMEEGKLSGKLKEIAEKLDGDENQLLVKINLK